MERITNRVRKEEIICFKIWYWKNSVFFFGAVFGDTTDAWKETEKGQIFLGKMKATLHNKVRQPKTSSFQTDFDPNKNKKTFLE